MAATKISPKLKRFVVVLFLLAAPVLWTGAAANQPELLRLEKSADAMGSTYSIALYGYDRVKMEAAVDAAFDEVRRLDDLLSNYRPASQWSQVNQHAAEHPVRVSPELFHLLSACYDYSRESEGAFDITVGPLMRVWGFYKGTGHLPHRAEVQAAMTKVGYKHMHLDPEAQTVSFDRSGVEIDPGGIGKGYAVDRMVEILRQRGFHTALVAGSVSSIYGMGAPPSDVRGWRVEIRDPHDASKSVAEVFLKDMSMSTSGSYEKFFRAEGKIYAHIMDPRTGYPAQGSVSVSVVAPRTIDSEAWAKPYFVNGRQWAEKHKPKDFRVFFCEDRMEHPCAWLP
ncbi:MAG TPA: FAD:protein FMN transferase [Bryobacteraceae bacterium]|nr:FAD:protein FMN transferase [Bryobacteraceae bacterium]